MKELLLSVLPYAISMVIGLVVYIVADRHISDDGLNVLMVNISSGLLSIPLIFISYELVKSACNKKLNDSLSKHICFEVNHYIVNMLKNISELLQMKTFSDETVDDLLQMQKISIKKHFKYTDNSSLFLMPKLQSIYYCTVSI